MKVKGGGWRYGPLEEGEGGPLSLGGLLAHAGHLLVLVVDLG